MQIGSGGTVRWAVTVITWGEPGGGLSRGSGSHTLAPQGDIMSLGRQVTEHFLQTERMRKSGGKDGRSTKGLRLHPHSIDIF